MPTAATLLSYEEWLELPENDEAREECVNGVIEKMPPAGFDHAWIVKRLTRQLERQFDETEIFVADSVFILAAMVRRDGYIHSAPELAIEVLSPSNSPRRVRELLADYASIGLPEVWVIDPDRRTIALHFLENGAYRSTGLPHDGVTNPVRFPSVTVDFSTIWP
ncbi:MAG: Uma2 family endonuclease [Acidobacteriota bacterium]